MLARIYSCAVVGLEGFIVEVEVDATQGFPGMEMSCPIKGIIDSTSKSRHIFCTTREDNWQISLFHPVH
jgi:hypothetical protein